MISSQSENILEVKQVKSDGRVYFYSQPDEKCKENIFVIKNDRLVSFKKFKYFDYVTYINKDNHTVYGWVKNADLVGIEYPEAMINKKDYAINIDGVSVYIGQSLNQLKIDVLNKTGKEIILNMIGNQNDATVFGVNFPFNGKSSIYVSDLNHIQRNNVEESVSQINIYSDLYKTNRGVKIGDDYNLVTQIYDPDESIKMQKKGINSLSYQYLDMNLLFNFNSENKVSSIVYILLPWSSSM